MVVGPLIILFYCNNSRNILWVALIILYMIILSVIFPPKYFDDFKLNFLSITASLSFYILGKKLTYRLADNSDFNFLAYGVNIFNIISLILYILIYLGLIDISVVYEVIFREDEADIFRFSLGNAIEMPFTMTCLLFSSIVLNRGSQSFIFSTFLNLLLAFISQSRIVVLMAFVLFMYEFFNMELRYRTLTGILIFILLLCLSTELSDLFNSILDRFLGNDAGSKEERTMLFYLFDKGLGFQEFIIGSGLSGSSVLRYNLTRVYGSIESVFFQLLYELGFFVTSFIFIPILKSNWNMVLGGRYRIALVLVYIQLLFFLPVFTSMIACFFLFGASSGKMYEDEALVNYETEKSTF